MAYFAFACTGCNRCGRFSRDSRSKTPEQQDARNTGQLEHSGYGICVFYDPNPNKRPLTSNTKDLLNDTNMKAVSKPGYESSNGSASV